MLDEIVEATQEEEYINFECFTKETGDARIKFENGVDLYVADLPHYYELSSEWLPFNDDVEEGETTYKGFMPRGDYAQLCVEHAEWEAK